MKLFFLFIFSFLSFSCIDWEEVEVSKDKNFVSLAVVSSYFEPDSLFRVYLSATHPAYSTIKGILPQFREAAVTDMSTGTSYPLTAAAQRNRLVLSHPSLKPQVGGNYHLRVKTDYPQADMEAQDDIPAPVTLLSAGAMAVEGTIDFFGYVKFQPVAGSASTSYYEIIIFRKTLWNKSENTGNDPFLQTGLTTKDLRIRSEGYYPGVFILEAEDPPSLLFRLNQVNEPVSFNFEYCTGGQSTVYGDFSYNHELRIEVRSVSRAYFTYKSSCYKQLYAAAGDYLYGMAPPVHIIGNIQNGTGVFGGYSKADTTFYVKGTIHEDDK